MKILITESHLLEILQKFVNKIKYDEVCKFVVDPELDENNDIWINAIISEDWYLYEEGPTSMNKVAWVNKIRREVREQVEQFTGFKVRVGSYVKKCE